MSRITHQTSGNQQLLESGKPVVLLLHGYGADERDLPELMNFLPKLPWVSPRAPEPSPVGGFSWYLVDDPIAPDQAAVSTATESLWLWINDNIPADSPLIVLGFSQGGLMATQLLRTHPERILGTIILAGFVFDGELAGDAQLKELKPKVFYGRGLQDPMIDQQRVGKLNAWLQSHSRAVTKKYDGLGHSIDQRVMADVDDFVETLLAVLG
jgi:phospholipase/carboxylesterase